MYKSTTSTSTPRRRPPSSSNSSAFITSPITFSNSSLSPPSSKTSNIKSFYHVPLTFNNRNNNSINLNSASSTNNVRKYLLRTSHLCVPCCRATIRMNVQSTSSSDHLPYSSSSTTNSSSTSESSSMTKTSTSTTSGKRKMSLAGVIFLIITYIWSIILIIPMLIAHPFVLLFDESTRRFHDFIAMAWMRCSLWTVRVRPKVINIEKIPKIHSKPVVYVANHTSYLDIFVFAYLFRRIKYVSKAEIFKIPIVGWAMAMAGNIALIRSSKRGQIQAYRKMVNTLKNGLSLVIFPEGTRSATGILKRFKPGAFRAAKQNNADVVPVTILGTRDVMPSSAYVPLNYPKSPISIVIHDPIDTQKFSVQQLCDKASKAVDSALPEHIRTWDGDKRKSGKDNIVNESSSNDDDDDDDGDNSGI